jgi:hypothetical protein
MMRSYREEFKLADIPHCGDHSCVCRPPSGMGTNGGCRCSQRDLTRAVLWYRHEYARLRAIVGAVELEATAATPPPSPSDRLEPPASGRSESKE